ncbi:MAG: hypothetical protein QG597_1333 [Actinomycetota bacterium]|jgi:quinol monooxygenase YgiN|nr:hypothetical protein [Actinomycetota bacterium]
MSDAPLYLTVHARPRPEQTDDAKALLTEMIAASRTEDGCELMEFVADEQDPLAWMVFERWSSRSLWEAHAATERNAHDGARLAPMLAEPLTLRFFVPS